jgi:sensor domain DACNV-containing protein
MNGRGYLAAKIAAPRILAHFESHAETHGPSAGGTVAVLPGVDTIEAMIDAAFWASLRREEGYVPKVSLALLAPDQSLHPLKFERPLPLNPVVLTRVAPAVERPGIHLGVWPDDHGTLQVWGTTRTIPTFSFVLEVAAPGLLVVKHHREEGRKFVNVAVLEGDEVKIVDEQASHLPECPNILSSLLGIDNRETPMLVQLAVSMRAHGRGGSLLVVPSGSDSWRESIVQPISYGVAPAFSELADLVAHEPDEDDVGHRLWQEAVTDAVHAVAGLTAVDGATVINDRYDLLAFGAKIARRRGADTVEDIVVTEPVEGGTRGVVHATRLGGTRHLSAAQFVHDQRDALALVASVDGRFTIFAWTNCENAVHAHRVEALLL